MVFRFKDFPHHRALISKVARMKDSDVISAAEFELEPVELHSNCPLYIFIVSQSLKKRLR